MRDFEHLGVFYLGRRVDADAAPDGEASPDEPILYDSRDLTTHAVCVGMTGSGKTGLGMVLLEEAAIDGVPILAIDPKGDLGNLLLAFPELRPADFEPWIDPADAARHGRSPAEHARAIAERWRAGLGEWGQDGARIRRFAEAAERALYTPGSRAGRPLALLRSLDAPPRAVADDEDALRERVGGAVSGLLGLMGLPADPIRSREHLLLSTLLDRAWREGRSLDLAGLIREVQKPPVERIGVLDLESVFPASDRLELAMRVNALVASPGFSVWGEGEPLDVGRLLYTPEGRPRLSIVSISHLSDPERMFVVTALLNEVVTWMRGQPGSPSLRALLYMDEIFGYFPPTANPPSKLPMLTLLKQARAFGVGVVLATQNPVDLDYKGLANAGTWFLGRLQTERDKARMIEGLGSLSAGPAWGRERLEALLSGLESRQFLMNNVHDDEPVLIETRWALSYLAGPLSREQIRALAQAGDAAPPAEPPAESIAPAQPKRPLVPPDVPERFLALVHPPAAGERLVYRPALLGTAALHYANARAGIDEWRNVTLLGALGADTSGSPWKEATPLGSATPATDDAPLAGAEFAELPAGATRAASYADWSKELATHLYRAHPLPLWRCGNPRLVSQPDEGEGAFRGRVREQLRAERDLEVAKLRQRFAPKLARLLDRIARAEQAVEVQESQYSQQKLHTAISVGATLVGALFGRKLASAGNVGRATTAARGASRAARERGDVARAQERVEALRDQLAALEAELEEAIDALADPIDPAGIEIESLPIAPRKSDIEIRDVALAWTPWRVDANGIARPAF